MKVAIVTGVLGGIGKAAALMLAEKGYAVVGMGRKPDGDLSDFDGLDVTYIPGDIASAEDRARLVAAAVAKGTVSVLVNVAGVAPKVRRDILEMTEETEKKMIAYTGDEKFFEHTDSYLAQERNESFTDLSDGKFQDMFGVIWDKGAQEGDFGIAIGHPIPDSEIGDYKFPEPDEKLIREKCERLVAQKDKFTMYIIGFSLSCYC